MGGCSPSKLKGFVGRALHPDEEKKPDAKVLSLTIRSLLEVVTLPAHRSCRGTVPAKPFHDAKV